MTDSVHGDRRVDRERYLGQYDDESVQREWESFYRGFRLAKNVERLKPESYRLAVTRFERQRRIND